MSREGAAPLERFPAGMLQKTAVKWNCGALVCFLSIQLLISFVQRETPVTGPRYIEWRV